MTDFPTVRLIKDFDYQVSKTSMISFTKGSEVVMTREQLAAAREAGVIEETNTDALRKK